MYIMWTSCTYLTVLNTWKLYKVSLWLLLPEPVFEPKTICFVGHLFTVNIYCSPLCIVDLAALLGYCVFFCFLLTTYHILKRPKLTLLFHTTVEVVSSPGGMLNKASHKWLLFTPSSHVHTRVVMKSCHHLRVFHTDTRQTDTDTSNDLHLFKAT